MLLLDRTRVKCQNHESLAGDFKQQPPSQGSPAPFSEYPFSTGVVFFSGSVVRRHFLGPEPDEACTLWCPHD